MEEISKLNAKRILVVDDDKSITTTFKLILQESGFIVDAYEDPMIALDHFRFGVYDLLLIDIRMPKMTGFELYEHIRKIDKKVNVCFITAFEVYFESILEEDPKIDTRCLIKKPIGRKELIDRVNKELSNGEIL